LADGFFIVAGDIEIQASQYALISAPGVLRIHVASDGDSEYIAPHGETLRSEGPSASVVIEPASQPAAQAVFAGYNRFVDVFIHREMLKLLYAGGEHELPPVLRAFLNGDLERTAARALPLGAALLRCLDDVHGCGIEGLRRRLFLQSKAVEILCHACEALERDELLASPEASAVTARSVLKAQRLLMENFVTPPSLESLAHEVGLSRSGLCAGFRQILGQSVFDYIQDLRMQQALALLNERTVSITQIAFAVGYNHVSSFSVAVQRRFGATPSELRRRNP
jgi:AraC-like DNA-binding protein